MSLCCLDTFLAILTYCFHPLVILFHFFPISSTYIKLPQVQSHISRVSFLIFADAYLCFNDSHVLIMLSKDQTGLLKQIWLILVYFSLTLCQVLNQKTTFTLPHSRMISACEQFYMHKGMLGCLDSPAKSPDLKPSWSGWWLRSKGVVPSSPVVRGFVAPLRFP